MLSKFPSNCFFIYFIPPSVPVSGRQKKKWFLKIGDVTDKIARKFSAALHNPQTYIWCVTGLRRRSHAVNTTARLLRHGHCRSLAAAIGRLAGTTERSLLAHNRYETHPRGTCNERAADQQIFIPTVCTNQGPRSIARATMAKGGRDILAPKAQTATHPSHSSTRPFAGSKRT